MAMATVGSISGYAMRQNTSMPKATSPTASCRLISATRRLLVSYTAQYCCAYDPSISYTTLVLFRRGDDNDEDDPVPLLQPEI
ncbi:hypothetical protein U1Q18_016897, partial [Sarracenia purpurea var. burkii]